MKKTLVCLAAAAAFFLSGMKVYSQDQQAEDHGKKVKEIQQLLTVMGTEGIQKQVLNMMIAGFRKDMPSVPQKFWDKAQVKMDQQLPELDEKLVDIYDQHFTQSDIEGLIAFYNTPVGKKYLHELPQVTQESYQAGSAWGKEIGETVNQELKQAGYE